MATYFCDGTLGPRTPKAFSRRPRHCRQPMATKRSKVASEPGRAGGYLPRRRPVLSLCFLLIAAACLAWSGCFEVVKRRPEAEKPWWDDPGNRPQGEFVQEDTAGGGAASAAGEAESAGAVASVGDSLPVNPSTPDPDFAAGMDAPASTTGKSPSRGSVAVAAAAGEIFGHRNPELDRKLQSLHTARTRSQKENVERVNEYALWCIENGMWKEARFHLEKALAADSVSASLSNNLGVVYERLGDRDKAELAYQRARALNPRREAYRTNLRRLQGRKSREVVGDGEPVDSLETGLEDLGLDAPVESGEGAGAGESGDPDGQNPGTEPESR